MNTIIRGLTPEQQKDFEPVPIELKRGECSFHHPLMVHGSYENRSEHARRAVVLNVFRDGVVSASDAPPNEGVPPIPTGEKMGGRFFPLLFDPYCENA
jgi:ectoine hydroxylase-related dioxygenase (phytanoyl-CoA dioxygenase family)